MDTERLAVEVYSSYMYAVGPRAFTLDNERRVVQSIERQWRTPGRLHFYVCDERGEFVELIYDETQDTWSARQFDMTRGIQPHPIAKHRRLFQLVSVKST